MNDPIHIFRPAVVLHGSGVALISDLGGQIHAEDLHGLFAGDTRVISTYKFQINDCSWELLGRTRNGHGSAQWHFQNPTLSDEFGTLEAGTVVLTLTRRVDGALHDDFELSSYAGRTAKLRLTLQFDADFADLFEVKSRSIPARLHVMRAARDHRLTLRYERAGFRRGLQVYFDAEKPDPVIAGSRLIFELTLRHGEQWHYCLEVQPEIDRRVLRMASDPHRPEPDPVSPVERVSLDADPLLSHAFDRGRQDLHALAMPQDGAPPYVAAGVPWFLTLFGRDALFPALMGGIVGSWMAEGALAALAPYQAKSHDDFRDAEPGKLPHELRHDELTQRGELPYSPYYGTHDAPSLYCLALWNAWRWSGRRALLDRYFDTAMRALQWCESHGDCDGDGLQEYRTRSPKGYRNQGWKDSSRAVVHADGRQAQLPLATIELQGYLYAARLAMAELMDEGGETAEAQSQREKAKVLRQRVEEHYWMEGAHFYAFALDGEKRQVDAIASNPAHLLWCGLPQRERAAVVAQRLVAPDMFTGWGMRTLSSNNPAYNPISYQRGSVWPFDTMIAAAGLWRYGDHAGAFALIKAVLDAAARFESCRLPELFGGFDRSYGAPVPYQKANIPQAWSSAASLLAAQLMLGIVPDAPRGCCYFQPLLPDWLPRLELANLKVGEGRCEIVVRRESERTIVEHLKGERIETVHGTPRAPLWGAYEAGQPVGHLATG